MVIMSIFTSFGIFINPFATFLYYYHKHCKQPHENVISAEYRCTSWFNCTFSRWNNNFFTFYSSSSLLSPLNKWHSLHASCQRCPQWSVRRAGWTCWGAHEYLKPYLWFGSTVGYQQLWRLSSPRPPAVQDHWPSDTNTWSHVFKWHKRI